MKVRIEMDEPLREREDWVRNGFKIESEIDEDATEFTLYNDLEEKIASFNIALDSFHAYASLERMILYDKSLNAQSLLEFFLDYLYTIESPYFKILGIHCYVSGSGMNDFLLRCAGFFQRNLHTNFYMHLNPNFEEILTAGTKDENLKNLFREDYNKYVSWQKKYINQLQEQLEKDKIYLNEFEEEGKNEVMIQAKRQDVLMGETILESLENKGLCR